MPTVLLASKANKIANKMKLNYREVLHFCGLSPIDVRVVWYSFP